MRPIDRWIGLKPQFRRGDAGYTYRRDGYGAPIPVSVEERDAFVRAGTRAFWWHVAAFALATIAAALLVDRMFAAGSGVGRASIVAVIASIIGGLLYASHRGATHVPARALAAAGRGPVGPAEAPPLTRWPSYPMILGGVLVVIFAIAQSIRTPVEGKAAFFIVAIAVGLGMAFLKWRDERRFTPAQKLEAKVQRAEKRRADTSRLGIGGVLIFLVFLLVEIVVMVLAFALVLGGVFHVLGTNWDDPSPLAFVFGLTLGAAGAYLAMWPFERLCRRLIGTTPGDLMSSLPM